MALPLLLDENLRDGRLWKAIQAHNANRPDEALDVIRVGDPGAPAQGTLDPPLLQWSIENRRVIVTRDTNTLIGHHQAIVDSGIDTPGLLILRRGFHIPELVDALVLVSLCLEPHECGSRTRYLPEP